MLSDGIVYSYCTSVGTNDLNTQMFRNLETELEANISDTRSVSVIRVNVDIDPDYRHRELGSESNS
jgi:hypothetical protein